MNDLTPMVWLVSAQFVLYAVGWGLCSLLLRERPLAVAHWAGYLLLTGTGFALTSLRGEPRTWWPYVGANLLFLTGYVNLRRGLEIFMGLPTRDREQFVTWALFAAGLVACGPGAETGPHRVMLAYASGAWILSRMTYVLARPMFAEFGHRLPLIICAPSLLLIVLFTLRVVQQALHMDQGFELHRYTTSNQSLLYGYLLGAAVFNFSFMGLVTTRLVGRLREQTLRDPLTGLPNRRALELALQLEWERVRRGGQGFAVLALDLDHFKRVNDTYGHGAGDAVLTQTGQRLREAVRKMDTVARTGGEEFIVLMPATTEEGARVVAERLRHSVCAEPYELPDGEGPLPLTISIGLALATEREVELRQLLQRADVALYKAKDEGRNRVCTA